MISRYVQMRGPPSSNALADRSSDRRTPRPRRGPRRRRGSAGTARRRDPGPGRGPATRRTRPAMMLKNPSPGPNWSDGLRIVQSSPDARTMRLGLGLGARVVQGRVVLDAQRAHVHEAPDAGRRASPRRPRACPSVLTSRRSAPPRQSRGMAARWTTASTSVERRRQGVEGRVTSPRRTSTARRARRTGRACKVVAGLGVAHEGRRRGGRRRAGGARRDGRRSRWRR